MFDIHELKSWSWLRGKMTEKGMHRRLYPGLKNPLRAFSKLDSHKVAPERRPYLLVASYAFSSGDTLYLRLPELLLSYVLENRKP
jgi:hypothetical protein